MESFLSATTLWGKSKSNAVMLLKMQQRLVRTWCLPISLMADAFSVKHVKFACDEPKQVIANEAPPASAYDQFDVLTKARTQRCLPEKRLKTVLANETIQTY